LPAEGRENSVGGNTPVCRGVRHVLYAEKAPFL